MGKGKRLTKEQDALRDMLTTIREHSDKAVDVIEKLMDSYGSHAASPSSLPFPMLIDLAYGHMVISQLINCEHCLSTYKIDETADLKSALEYAMGSLITFGDLVINLVSFNDTDGSQDGWIPSSARETLQCGDNLNAEQLENLISERKLTPWIINYFNCLVYEAALRIAAANGETFSNVSPSEMPDLCVHEAFEFGSTDIYHSLGERLTESFRDAQSILKEFVEHERDFNYFENYSGLLH